MQTTTQTLSPIRINFDRNGWNNRLIHNRDRSWLELLPTGSTPTEKSMFQAVTLLDTSDADVLTQLSKWLDAEAMDNLSNYDAYVVYRTTCG